MSTEYPATARPLLQQTERLTSLRLWQALTSDERARAASVALASNETAHRTALIRAVSRAKNFRPKTVEKWPDQKIANEVRPPMLADAALANRLLEAFGEGGYPELHSEFEERVARNEDGEVSDAAARETATHLVDRFGERDAVFFLLTTSLADRPLARALRGWFADFEAATDRELSTSVEAREQDVTEGDTSDTSHEPDRQEKFTTLDRLLILAAVDARQDVQGAEPEDAIDDAVGELIQLSGRRHRSYFHAGFRDALFDRPLGEEIPAENEARLRWYWNGAIQGLARTKSWERIVRVYDDKPPVKELGNGGDAPSRQAARHIVTALEQQERWLDIPVFLQPRGVTLELFRLILSRAAHLLRDGVSASRVQPLLDILDQSRPLLRRSEGTPRNFHLFLAADRCAARCPQQLGEFDAARRRLQVAVRSADSRPGLTTALETDLGLIEGAFRSLTDVQLPHESGELDSFANRLRGSKRRFESEHGNGVHGPGRYCLGVLELIDGDHEAADRYFGRARGLLQREPARFSPDAYPAEFFVRLGLYEGIAKLLAATTEDRLVAAADLLADSLKEGARIPRYFVEKVREHLDLVPPKSSEPVLLALLEEGDDHLLDTLVGGTKAPALLKPLAKKFLARAKRPTRGREEEAADYRAALECQLAAGEEENAEATLDRLEELALKGTGVAEFLGLLETEDCGRLPWSREEAEVGAARVRANRGQYEEAASGLTNLFHRYAGEAASGDREALEGAAGILGTIRGYGLPQDWCHDLELRYEAIRSEQQPLAPGHDARSVASKPVTVLVVGGNEIQARDAERVEQRVKQDDPCISLDFVHSGWTSNWNKHLEDVKRKLDAGCNALVILRFIRTQLGRKVRAECGQRGIQWRFSWSGGQGGLIRAVHRAAEAGRQTARS